MITIIRHELRRVLPIGLVLLASAVLFGCLDVALNARKAQLPGISLYYCVLLAAPLIFGAASFARTGRDTDSRFLGLWPMSRRRIALVRVPLHALLAALGLVFSFVICGTILRLGGHDPWDLLFCEVLYEPWFLPVGLAALALIFGLALLWSQLAETAMAAPLVLVTGATLTAGFAWLVGYALLAFGGPWLTPFVGDALAHTERPTLDTWVAAVLAVLALIAALHGAARAPLLEAKRRAAVTFGALGLLVAALSVVILAVAFPLRQPPLRWLKEVTSSRSGVLYADDVTVDDTGRHAVVQLTGPGAALWAIDLRTGKLRRLARGEPQVVELATSGNLAAFTLYDHVWAADLNTGRLHRLPAIGPEMATLSPSGRYWFTYGQNGQAIITDGRTTIPLGLGDMILGWQGEQAVFLLSSDPDHTVRRVSLPDGAERVIARNVPIAPWEHNLSPRGRWIVGRLYDKGHDQVAFGLLNTTTGKQHRLDGVHTGVWSADDRYLWVTDSRFHRPRHLRVLDTQAMTFGPAIGPEQLHGDGPSLPYSDPQRQRVYFRARPARSPGDAYWSADISGGDLRKLGDIHATPWGVSAEGQLVMRDSAAVFLLDPQTLARRVLLRVGGP